MTPEIYPTDQALLLDGICKRFPGVIALDWVNLELRRGEIHALVGENGAGKSTLIKILTGVQPPDEGGIHVAGTPVSVGTPLDARRLGISTVPQEILIVPELSIGRNILLGLEGPRAFRDSLSIDEAAIVDEALRKVGATFRASTKAKHLSVPHLRLAQIARALIHVGDIMVLDEPTAVLSEPDAEHLMERLVAFRAEGKAILYVTHRLSEVMRLADRITILRDGKRVGHFLRGEIDRQEMVRLMAKVSGPPRPMSAIRSTKARDTDETAGVALAVSGLTAVGRFSDVDLRVEAGEVLGIAGVQGSGHGHLLRAIAGVDPTDAGTVSLDGETIPHGSVQHAYDKGILLVPADRRRSAIVPSMSIEDNIILSRRIRGGCRRFGLRWPGREREMVQSYVLDLGIQPPNLHAKAGNLSGGNQQKVAIARALEGSARVLLVEEPTQGIDVRTKVDIHALLRNIARRNRCAVIVASSEFEELIGLADRIHVMRLGRLVGTLPGTDVTYHQILEHALP
jgi:ABC-type sugar transport system ATPase subunit